MTQKIQRNPNQATPPKLLRVKQVAEITSISTSYLHTLARNGKFPKPKKLTENTSVWLESEVYEWINDRLGIEKNEGVA